VENLVELTDKFEKQPLLDRKTESCSDASVQNSQRMDKGSPAIDVELEEVNETAVRVKVTPYQESFKNGTLNFVQALKPLKFEVSFFDLPYMDNTRLFDGSRFALLLSHIDKKEEVAEINAIIFKGEFMSLRDRPFFEEMLQKLNKDAKTNCAPRREARRSCRRGCGTGCGIRRGAPSEVRHPRESGSPVSSLKHRWVPAPRLNHPGAGFAGTTGL
jgi:hypothetical protein